LVVLFRPVCHYVGLLLGWLRRLLWLGLLSEPFIFLFHFSEFFVGVLFLSHCLSSFSFHFGLESLHLFFDEITNLLRAIKKTEDGSKR
jgi:hypothetical protein